MRQSTRGRCDGEYTSLRRISPSSNGKTSTPSHSSRRPSRRRRRRRPLADDEPVAHVQADGRETRGRASSRRSARGAARPSSPSTRSPAVWFSNTIPGACKATIASTSCAFHAVVVALDRPLELGGRVGRSSRRREYRILRHIDKHRCTALASSIDERRSLPSARPIACCRPLDDDGLTAEDAEATAAVFKALVGPGASPDREPPRAQPRARVRLRAHPRGRALAADRQPPPEEARPGRPAPAASSAASGPSTPSTATASRARRASSTWKEQPYEHRRARGGAGALRGGCARPRSRQRLRVRLREHRLLRRGGDDALRQGPLRDRRARRLFPTDAVSASLGCGNPVAVADLHEGETVLDLGSGGGIDVLLSARRVGPTGTVYGLDMTDEMLALAQRNAREAGATNVHFLKGLIEDDPSPRRERRRRDLELRREPLAREGQGARRDRARAPARRPRRDHGRRRRGPPHPRRPRRARQPRRVHRGRAVR